MRTDGVWDVRCPPELKQMFPHPRKGWWYKVDRNKARLIVAYLSIEYGVPIPHLDDSRPPTGWNGAYYFKHQLIRVHARAHLKSVFHEWYHHLDEVTGGEYDSSDYPGMRKLSPVSGYSSKVSLAWQFADRMFTAMR